MDVVYEFENESDATKLFQNRSDDINLNCFCLFNRDKFFSNNNCIPDEIKASIAAHNVENQNNYQEIDTFCALAYVTEELYFGYWGYNDKSSNYKVEYLVEPDSESKYGCIIQDIRIKEIDSIENNNNTTNVTRQTAFYGIWIGASKNESEAIKLADSYADLNGYDSKEQAEAGL